MKKETLICRKSIATAIVACAALTCIGLSDTAQAQNPSGLSPDLQEIVTLSSQHMADDVITNYIKSSAKSYKLSATDIIYLNSQGVSQGVISALLQTAPPAPAPGGPAPAPGTPSMPPPVDASSAPSAVPPTPVAPAPAPSAAPATFAPTVAPSPQPPMPPVAPTPMATQQPGVPPTPSLEYFQAQLTPYGNWVDLPGYGVCWQPAVNFGWRPYYDGGHWESTDAGWYWQSEYPWGDLAFHYGRWAYTPSGWVWVPGYEYAPAWVFWRHADEDGFIGWAPLPVGAVFVEGGWRFHGARVAVDFDFGLGVDFFTFVGCDHFWEHDYRRFIVPRDRVVFVFRRSVIENHYRFEHGRYIHEGLPRERMAALTHRDIHEIRARGIEEVRRDEEHQHAVARAHDIHDFKPGARPNATRMAESRTEGAHTMTGSANERSEGASERNVSASQRNATSSEKNAKKPTANPGNRPKDQKQ